jgi:hypothetical protein
MLLNLQNSVEDREVPTLFSFFLLAHFLDIHMTLLKTASSCLPLSKEFIANPRNAPNNQKNEGNFTLLSSTEFCKSTGFGVKRLRTY